MSNFYGMLLARHHLFPELKTKGMFGVRPLVAFTSEESHYSIVKGANLLGLGVDNVVKVKTDKGECAQCVQYSTVYSMYSSTPDVTQEAE